MNELLNMYAWTIAAGVLAAMTLALIGCQMAARDKAMQTLCLGQGSMLGVLVGIALIGLSHEESELVGHVGPFVSAVVCAGLVTWVAEKIARRRNTSKNSYFTALFAGLLALNYLFSAIFPGLESHVAQVFFGDLATLNEFDVRLTVGLALFTLVWLARFSFRISNRSFELATFGEQGRRRGFVSLQSASDILMFLFVCFSIQFLGFLFTIAQLFVPTAVLAMSRLLGLRRHLVTTSLLAAMATGGGFLVSLNNSRLPTVPTIVTMMVVLGGLLLLALRFIHSVPASSSSTEFQ